jgi:diacylglycerol kinase family enzyme
MIKKFGFQAYTVRDYMKDADFMDLKLQVVSPSIPVDLIRIGDRYVANMCNIGFDATVAHNFVKFKSIPGVSGKLAYAISVFYCLIHKISTHMDIVIDDETTISDNMLLCSVSKGIYCGGQYRTAPKADVSDGFMDILPIKKITRPQFLKFFKHYKNGTHIVSPALQKYVTYLKCKKAEIKGAKNLPVCFDGDTAFLDGDVVFELVKDAVNVIVPAKNVAECQKEAVQAL